MTEVREESIAYCAVFRVISIRNPVNEDGDVKSSQTSLEILERKAEQSGCRSSLSRRKYL